MVKKWAMDHRRSKRRRGMTKKMKKTQTKLYEVDSPHIHLPS
jgi:hypothetical protein